MKDILSIKDDISLFLDNSKNIEIEAKFGIFKKHFHTGIISFYFDRIKKHFKDQLCEENSTVYMFENQRKIVYDDKTIFQQKENLRHFDFPDYNIRVSVNEETEIDQLCKDFSPKSIRVRKRSFVDFGKYKLDITFVTDELKTEYKESFEVEIELLDFNYFEEFVIFVSDVFKILHQTELVYKNYEKELLNSDIGEILNHDKHMNFKYTVENKNFKKGPFIYKSCLVEPRNLTEKDICSLGFFGRGSPYFLTFKADGLRKMLIIHSTGMWLVYPPFEYNLILRPEDNTIYNKLMSHNIFVIDGELIPSEKSKYRFLAFDCLAKYFTKEKKTSNLQDCSDIQYKTLEERMNCVQTLFINNIYQLKNTKISPKSQKDIEKLYSLITVEMKYGIKLTKDNFFNQIEEMQNTKVDYETDGFILTPIKSEYNLFPQLYKKRILEKVPDVCKLKKHDQITIDFMVMRNENNLIELYVAKDYTDGKHSEAIPFKVHGTEIMVDQNNELTKDVRSGTIVEYYWDPNRCLFTPKLIRTDKQAANRYSVVINNWKDLMNPITNDDITGKTLKLVYTYHNRIKKYLYSKLKDNSNILVIGDDKIPKRITGKVLNIHNSDIKDNTENPKRIKIKAKGQETKKITKVLNKHVGGKVDAIVMFLSLSEFWKSKKDLDALCQTIDQNLKKDGKVLFMTVDGDLIEEKMNLERKLNFSKGTEYTVYYNKAVVFGKKIKVMFFNQGQVRENDQYMVHMKCLTRRLENFGIKLVEYNIANKEELLSEFQKEYSSTYSYGYYQRV